LHPQLVADCFVIGELPVCRLLLMNDSRYPWCILVPRFPDLTELHDVPPGARAGLWQEIEAVAHALRALPPISKINVAALGNVVPQLHVHVIGRHRADAAWPAPVWGQGAALPYDESGRSALETALRQVLPSLHH
jgi:diadenosine tetraphosphate (Ap4A) HIT family hydrolase